MAILFICEYVCERDAHKLVEYNETAKCVQLFAVGGTT
jgi:hypothetical protein